MLMVTSQYGGFITFPIIDGIFGGELLQERWRRINLGKGLDEILMLSGSGHSAGKYTVRWGTNDISRPMMRYLKGRDWFFLPAGKVNPIGELLSQKPWDEMQWNSMQNL